MPKVTQLLNVSVGISYILGVGTYVLSLVSHRGSPVVVVQFAFRISDRPRRIL